MNWHYILFFLFQLFIFQSATSQIFDINGKWRTLDLYHNVIYNFDSSSTVLIKQYGRELIGSYSIHNDTVSIFYRPFFTLKQSKDEQYLSDSLIINLQEYYFNENRNKTSPSNNKTLTVYYPDSRKVIFKTNDKGYVSLPYRSKIDSIHINISPSASIKIPADSIFGNRINVSANIMGVDISGFASLPKEEKMVIVNSYKLVRLNRITIEIEPAIFLFRLEKDSTYLKVEDGILNARLIDYGSPYLLQQYCFYEWRTVDTIFGQGKMFVDINNYKFPFLHSGINRFALKSEKRWRPCIFEIESKKKKVKIKSTHVTDYLEFNDETYYELYHNDKLIITGRGKRADLRNLDKGLYYLNYDNETYVKIKKR